MLKKFEKRLAALEKVLNAPPRPVIFRHPRFYKDGRPLPPEVIALYKRRRTNEEGRVLFFLSRGDGHTYLSPEERKAYNAQCV
jgi:hypothetical protein